MVILDVIDTEFNEVKIIQVKKFSDNRGYFSEVIRFSDIISDNRCNFLTNKNFNQINESYSIENVFRGFHFQFNPYMDKLIRCVSGKLIDFALDIRKNSPNFGKVISIEIENNKDFFEWVWVPSGFAHGIYLPIESTIEYICTGYWNGKNEYSISLYDREIDWSMCKFNYNQYLLQNNKLVISEKDKNGISLALWLKMEESNNFIYYD